MLWNKNLIFLSGKNDYSQRESNPLPFFNISNVFCFFEIV